MENVTLKMYALNFVVPCTNEKFKFLMWHDKKIKLIIVVRLNSLKFLQRSQIFDVISNLIIDEKYLS